MALSGLLIAIGAVLLASGIGTVVVQGRIQTADDDRALALTTGAVTAATLGVMTMTVGIIVFVFP